MKGLELLQVLCEIPGAASDEGKVASFVKKYVETYSPNWKVQPKVISGQGFQDCIILVFGKPRTAIYAHMDSIGFSIGYGNSLIKVGGPRLSEGLQLVGTDSQGEIDTELMIADQEDGSKELFCVSERTIDRGTLLTFKPNFRETETHVQSPYLDNRLGMWNALKVAETLEDGAIVFSCYEEHGGNAVGACARYLLENYGVYQALISDITWATIGVPQGKGVAISMRDSMLPRRSYLNRIIELAKESNVDFQLEVESAGGSDGGVLQKSDLPIDWCFIGAAEDNVHTPDEIVAKYDIMCMVELYKYLMIHL